MDMEFKKKIYDEEVKAWRDMFDLMCKTFNLTREELNDKKKYKPLFDKIEIWGEKKTQVDIMEIDVGGN